MTSKGPPSISESQQQLKAAFSILDPSGEGFITLQRLREVVRELDLGFTESEMRDMIEEADPTGDGKVSFDGINTMFIETQLKLSEETQKLWKDFKNRVPLPKYRKRFVADKVKVIKKPGKKLSEQEAKNLDRFNKLSLTSSVEKQEKTRVIKKPGVKLRERRELELERERASEDEDETDKTHKNIHKNRRVIGSYANRYANTNKQLIKKESVELDVIVEDRVEDKVEDKVVTKDKMSQRSVHYASEGNYGEDEYSQLYNRHYQQELDQQHDDQHQQQQQQQQQQHEQQQQQSQQQQQQQQQQQRQQQQQQQQQQHRQQQKQQQHRHSNATSLPPIEKHNGVSPHHSPTSSRKAPPVYERLYDPDYRKNRSIPTEPEPVYVREFKSRPPKKLEHVKSKHMDPAYFEPRGEYILETDEEPQSPQFKAKLPKGMEHIESRHLNPEYQKRHLSSDEAGSDDQATQFHARLPPGMEHVQSKILDPKYYTEKPKPQEEYYDTEFRARPPKKLENVQSRIMDPKYFQEKPVLEEERYDTEFRARLPKNLEHVQSRLLDPPKKPKQSYEEPDSISLPSFRAKPPKHLEQISSRILDPHYYEPKPDHSTDEEDKYDHNFKAKMPKGMQHVESRVLDPKYFKKKIPPIPTDEREAQNLNHDFKARLPKNLAHVQSRAFDPAYNRQLQSPRSGSPVVELKQRGQVMVINVKKNPERRSKSQGHKEKVVSPRGHYYLRPGAKTGLGLSEPEDMKILEKKERKPWRPPRKPKPERIDKDFFDSWNVTPTHIYRDNNDMFYKNRRHVSDMWTSLAHTINQSVIDRDRVYPVERSYY